MLKRLLAAFFFVVASTAVSQDRAGIEQTISDQLEAFNARDVNTAWSFASPMIQGMFGSPENFGMMVQRGYPMVWTNDAPEFMGLREQSGRIVQTVRLRDTSGQLHVLDYEMLMMNDIWLINGVYLVPQPGVSA